jgi:hypothetical protein
MTDPYRTPQSDVEVIRPISKAKWKVFFWIVLFLEIISIVFMIIDPEESALEIVAELIIYPIIIIGIFGFAYGRRILFSRLWITMIPVGLSYDVYVLFTLDWAFGSTEEMYVTAGLTAVIFFPLMFFQYLALYKYSFKSPEVWLQST